MLVQNFLSTHLPAYQAITRHDNNAKVSFLVALALCMVFQINLLPAHVLKGFCTLQECFKVLW